MEFEAVRRTLYHAQENHCRGLIFITGRESISFDFFSGESSADIYTLDDRYNTISIHSKILTTIDCASITHIEESYYTI